MAINDISKTISQFVENQFPSIYREDGEVLVAFVKAYYEYLEENKHIMNRDMFAIKDIDTTYDEFVEEFRKKYLEGLPFVSTTDDRFLVKNIIDLYRSKGSDESVRLLLRLLFNVDSEIYYPGRDVLRASDSLWVTPKYIEVLSSDRSLSFVDKEIFGSVSGTKAFVDAIVTKRSNNRLIDILYLSQVQGSFIFGEIVTDDGVLEGAPRVTGSLTDITITSTQDDPGGNITGDKYNVVSGFGKNGVVSVSSKSDQSTGINFELLDGGYGYTLASPTRIAISDVIAILDNSTTTFALGDILVQRIEKINFLPSDGNDLFTSISLGDELTGNFVANTTPITGLVMGKGTETVDNISSQFLNIQLDVGETFAQTQILTLGADTLYDLDSELEEESEYLLNLTANTGAFTPGEQVYQREFLANTSNTVSTLYNFGTFISIDANNAMTVSNAFGNFLATSDLVGETSGAVGTIDTDVTAVFNGATGTIVQKNSNTEYVVSATKDFVASNIIRSKKSKVFSTVSSSENISVDSIEFGSTTANTFSSASTHFKGELIGQSAGTLEITTLENNFLLVSENTSVISDAAGNELTIPSIDPGVGAGFKIGSLENTEVILFEDELIGSENVASIPYTDMIIGTGEGSGIGHIDSISVNSGGTGYSNSSIVTFTGGGYLNQNPLIDAIASVTTDVSGTITSITIIEKGEGYYGAATIAVADGSSATFDINMTYGYGFPKEVYAGYDTIISDALTTASYEIGTISSITQNRPGEFYGRTPVLKIENPTIVSFNRRDQIVNISNRTGIFTVGEIVTQATNTAEGVVRTANTTSITLKNTSFAESFVSGLRITGTDSLTEADATSVEYANENLLMGQNAIVKNEVNVKIDVVTSVKVINSGFGYQDNEEVSLEKIDGSSTIIGIVNVEKQGVAPGYWKSRTSHLNSEKRLHDNKYYQDYSYDIKTSINIENYRNIVLDILHVAGTQFFGSLVKTTAVDPLITTESYIEQT
jgi:hypothetical protein